MKGKFMIGKAHQRIIRDKKSKEIPNDLFGNYWDNINTDIDNGIIKVIDYQTAKKIILEYEWLGSMGTTQIHYGIFLMEIVVVLFVMVIFKL